MRPRSPRVGIDGKALPPVVDDLLPGDQRDRYLAMLRTRVPPGVAAREFGLTGSQIRSLRRRDPEFDREFQEAWGEGENFYEERLAVEARLRATEGKSDRILEVELATHGGPKYAHLRRDRMKVDANVHVDGAVVVAFTPDLLASLDDDTLDALERVFAKAQAEEVVEGEFREIAPAEIPEKT